MYSEFVLTCIVFAHAALVWWLTPEYDALNPAVLIDVFVLIYWGWGVYNDPFTFLRFQEDWHYGFYVIIGILALYAGLHVHVFRFNPAPQITSTLVLDTTWLWVAFAIHLLCASVLLVHSAAERGIFHYLIGARLGTYLRSEILASSEGIYYEGMTVTLAPVLMLLYANLKRGVHLLTAIVYLGLLYAALSVFRTRLGLVIIFLLPFFYLYRRYRRQMGWIILPLILACTIGLLALLQAWRGFGMEALVEGPGTTQTAYTASLEGTSNTVRAFRWLGSMEITGTLPHESGLNYWYCLATFIPRALWHDKPLTAFEPRWTEHFLHQKVGSGIPIWTFTAWGEGLAQFGIYGIVLNLFLYGLLVQFIARMLSPRICFFAACNAAVISGTFLRGGVQALWVFAVIYTLPALACLQLCFRSPSAARLQKLARASWLQSAGNKVVRSY